MKTSFTLNSVSALGLAIITTLIPAGPSWAGLISSCTPETCTWEISVDGNVVESGTYTSNPDTGDFVILNPVSLVGNGYTATINNLSGNLDPLLGFGLGATNTSGAAKNFSFAFSLPLGALSAPISTQAQLGTTLTAFTSAGGSVFPTLGGGKIVDSQDIIISPFSSVDKGVDIGAGLSVASMTTATSTESATGSIISGGPFDLMSVTVAFGLTDQTGVGFSGFVEQTAVPVPPAVWLFGTGLMGLIGIARRKALT